MKSPHLFSLVATSLRDVVIWHYQNGPKDRGYTRINHP